MSLSPFTHPFLSGLFGDAELARLFSAEADITAMVAFEIALAKAEAEAEVIPAHAAKAIAALDTIFSADMEGLRAGTGQDGVVVPALIEQMRGVLDKESAPYLHFGATSQDVIDTSLVLRLKAALPMLDNRLEVIISLIEDVAIRFGERGLMGRTRMQEAVEITVRDRLADWVRPLLRCRKRLGEIAPRLLVIQFGGAVGTREKLGKKGLAVAEAMARELDLRCTEKSWHNQRDNIVECANWLTLVTGSLGKIGQDMALMAQSHEGHIILKGGGTSSAMPHKSNPIAAEVLVSLARYTGGASGTMAQALVHEQERSGAAWTLEWLVLPSMVMASGSATLLAQRLLGSVKEMGLRA